MTLYLLDIACLDPFLWVLTSAISYVPIIDDLLRTDFFIGYTHIYIYIVICDNVSSIF